MEEGIVTETSALKRRVTRSLLLEDPPKPKRLKSSLTGRVGVSTEKRKVAINIDLKPYEKNINIIEEIAPIGNDIYDVPFTENEPVILIEDENDARYCLNFIFLLK